MATLENVFGSSFSPDLAQILQNVRAAGNQRAAQTQATEQQRLAGVAGGQGTAQEKQAALIQLTSMNAPLGKAVNDIIASGDTRQAQALLQQKEKGTRNALLVKGAKSLDGKRLQLNEWAKRIAVEPDSPDKAQRLQRVMDLKNLSLDQLNVELQRIENAGKSIDIVFKEQAAELQAEKEQGARDANRMLSLPENEQFPELIALMQKAQSEGDTDEVNALRKLMQTPFAPRQAIFRDIAGQVPAAKPVSLAAGTRLVDPATKQTVVEAEQKPPVPLTKVGKGRTDLKNGIITQADFDSLASLGEGGTVKLGPDSVTMINGKPFFAQQVLSGTGKGTTVINEIPGEIVNPKTGLTLKQEQDLKAEAAGQTRQKILDVDQKMLPRIEGAKISVKQRLAASNEAFKKLPALDEKIGLYDQAIDAVNRGAGTGAIEKMMPTFRAASFELQTIQQQIGLNILSGVTMGSLSENEMSILLSTAIPTGLDSPQLKVWLETRKSATIKLRKFTEDAVIFLRDPDNDLEGFIAKKRSDRAKGNEKTQPSAATPTQTTPGPAAGGLNQAQKSRLEQLRNKQR